MSPQRTSLVPALGCLGCSIAAVLTFVFFEDLVEALASVHGHPDGPEWALVIIVIGALGWRLRKGK